MMLYGKKIIFFLAGILVILLTGCGRQDVITEEKDVISDKYTAEYIPLDEDIRLPKLLNGKVYYAKDNSKYASAVYCMDTANGQIISQTISMGNRPFNLGDFTADLDGCLYYALTIKPENENISQWERCILKQNAEGEEEYFQKIPETIGREEPLFNNMQADEQGRVSFRNGIYQFDENGQYLGREEPEFDPKETKEFYYQTLSLEKFGINSKEVTEIAFLEDGRIEALVRNKDTGIYGLYVLTPSETSVYEDRKELVLGVLQGNELIRSLVVDFNKNHQDVYVTIREYQPSGSLRTSDEAVSVLTGDFLAGNGPDLIALSSGGDHAFLAGQGILENLQPYVDQSDIICQEDFLTNAWNLGRQDELLYAIPMRFSLQTLAGKVSILGDRDGWTVADLTALAREHPESLLIDPSSKSSLFSLCCTFQADTFVDREAAECHFDSPRFYEILEFADTFAKDPDSIADTWKYQEDQILLMETDLYSAGSYQSVCQAFGMTPLNFIGYPTRDGSPGHIISQCNEMYGISSRSEHKQEAWKFVEYCVQWNAENTQMTGFPANRTQLEQWLKEKTDSGELEPQSAENLKELLIRIADESVAEITWGGEAAILYEEIMFYFNGQRSIDETIHVIENRISLYLKEGN